MQAQTIYGSVTLGYPDSFVGQVKSVFPDHAGTDYSELYEALKAGSPLVEKILGSMLHWDYPPDKIIQILIEKGGDTQLLIAAQRHTNIAALHDECQRIISEWAYCAWGFDG